MFAAPNLNGSGAGPPQSLAVTKRAQPGALTATIEKGISKSTARTIPAFLTKLFTMVDDSATDHLIRWSEPSGDSFFVVSSERFGRELLPKYFKHSNFGSFVRQLNMYGFHKVPHLNQGVLQGEVPETEMLEFTNPHFQKGQPDMLCFIQRKKSGPESGHPVANSDANDHAASATGSVISSLELQTLLTDVAAIRKHQSLLSSDLKTLQNSNAHLWQEAIESRNQNKRCQETINKILGFLAQVFGGKISNINKPARGNTGARTARPEVNLSRASADGDDIDILMSQGATNGNADNFRTRNGETRDGRNNLSFPSSSSDLSHFNKPRAPRLMLEDTQRWSDPMTGVTLEQHLDQNNSLCDGKLPLRDIVFSSDSRDTLSEATSSPVATPRAQKSSSTARLSPTRAPNSPGPSARSLDSSQLFAQSPPEPFIDPTLDEGFKNDIRPTNGTFNESNPDQTATDAVLQALFADRYPNGAFNLNDALLSTINWSDLLNVNELNPIDGTASSFNPAHRPPSPGSPLRITNGSSKSPSPSLSSRTTTPSSINTKTFADLHQQSNVIENVTDKVETLEAVIERLVGSLPDTVEDLPICISADPQQSSGQDLLIDPNTTTGKEGQLVSDFDADAFIRTLLPSEVTAPKTASAGSGTEPFVVLPDGAGDVHLPTNLVMDHLNSREDERCDLDLERILDEWTSEDVTRSPAIQPCPDKPHSTLESTNPRPASTERQPAITPLASADDLAENSTRQFVFDLNDDDQLRRIMSKRPANTNSSPPTQSVNRKTTGNANASALNYPKKRINEENAMASSSTINVSKRNKL